MHLIGASTITVFPRILLHAGICRDLQGCRYTPGFTGMQLNVRSNDCFFRFAWVIHSSAQVTPRKHSCTNSNTEKTADNNNRRRIPSLSSTCCYLVGKYAQFHGDRVGLSSTC